MFIRIEKGIALFFFAYLIWFKEAYSTNNIILYGSVLLLTLVVIIDAFKNDIILKITNVTKMYFVLFVYSFLSGIIIATNKDVFLEQVIRFFVFIILCFDCEFISRRDHSIDWLLKLFIICAVLCSIQTIILGVSYNGGAVITMSRHNNPNKLGLTMVIGVMALFYRIEKVEKQFILHLALVGAFIYTTMLTASRKSFLAIAILFVFWIKDYMQSVFATGNRTKKMMATCVLCSFIALSLYFVFTIFNDTIMFSRLSRLGTSSDSERRLQLYHEAFDMWKRSPFIGLGFSQFQENNSISRGYYSHSTYAEALSCLGSIGFLIFFIPLFKIIYIAVELLKSNKQTIIYNSLDKYKIQMAILCLFLELLLGTVLILFYEIDHMVLLMVLCFEIERFSGKANIAENEVYNKADENKCVKK